MTQCLLTKTEQPAIENVLAPPTKCGVMRETSLRNLVDPDRA